MKRAKMEIDESRTMKIKFKKKRSNSKLILPISVKNNKIHTQQTK